MASSDNGFDYTVIVSGLPRSGTSMMMQMLHAGGMEVLSDGQRAADEDNPKGYFEFEAVKKTREDPSWLAGSEGKAVKMVYKLLYDLPLTGRKYKVIFMRRETAEVIRSQNIMLQRHGKDAGGLDPAKLEEIFRAQIAQVIEWLDGQPAFEYLVMDYNLMLQDPEPHLARLNHFLGMQLETCAMRQVVDPKLYRNRQKSGS
jgi:hypothetical protein